MKALIGVTPDTHDGAKLRSRTPMEKIVYLWDSYLHALQDHGAIATLLGVTEDKKLIRAMVDRLDGIILAGGNFDVPPEFFGEKPKPWLGKLKPERSRFELALLKEAMRQDLPVLGICGGMQAINVAFGGTLYQDIFEERKGSGEHQQKIRKDRTSHQVTIAPGTRLREIITGRMGKDQYRLRVNSTHHQAVRDLATGLIANAVATDGVIEGIESEKHRFMLGVQWHPELLYKRSTTHDRIFRAFVRASLLQL